MEELARVVRELMRGYTYWYRRRFLPDRRYSVFLSRAEGGRTCLYFTYDVTEEIDGCLRRCRGNDDCLTACYEDVEDSVDEFLCEQADGFEELLRRRGVEAEPDCIGGYGGADGTVRWMRLCVPR